jgi:hypothetical protein
MDGTTAMLTAVFLLLAPPGDAVHTLDLGRLPWTRALALEGQTVRVRLVVANRPAVLKPGTVLLEAEGPEEESRTVALRLRAPVAVGAGDELTVEGTLRVVWHRPSGEFPGFVEVRVVGRLAR